MKKHIKLTAVILLAVAAIALLCSCTAPNTVSTGTKYKLVLVTELFPAADGVTSQEQAEFALGDNTVSGCAWAALKEYRKKTYDDATTDKLAAIKYYTPAAAEGSDSVTYSSAFTTAAKKQLELAASGGAEVIVLSNDDFSGAYLEVKDTTKTFGDVSFVILTVPGSRVSEAASLNAKTTAVIFDARQYGYLFGYYAASNGFKNVAYVGADNAASKAFTEGLEKAAAAQGISSKSVYTASGPVDSVVNADIAKAAEGADLLIGDELTSSFIAASGKKYASIYKDDKAEFSVTINASVITAKLADIINECRQINAGTVRTLSAGDGIFVYSGDTALVEVPDFSASAE